MRVGATLAAGLMCTFGLGSCQSRPQQSAPPLPAGPQVVEVDLADYRFDYEPAIAAGPVLFRVTNTGSVAHSLTMLPLAEDIPPIDQQLRGSERRAITPFAGMGPHKPGSSTSFAVQLEPGLRYALVCFVVDDQDNPHFLRGMSSEFRASSVAPVTAATTGFS